MRSIFAGIVVIVSTGIGYGQANTPAVTNLAGFDGTQDGSVVTMSIGEPAITTLSNPAAIITQGFLQPEILPCLEVQLSYYPNPTTSDITLEAGGCETQIESIELLNFWGQIITTVKLGKDNKIVLDGLAQAVYLIRVRMSSGFTQSIKIVKLAP